MNFADDYDPSVNFLKTHLMACHLLENNNRSSISEKAMKQAIPSFYNRPILGYIQKIDDGDGNYHYDFAGHEMGFDDDGDIEYKEAVVGVIPESCNPQLVYHKNKDKTYLEVDGLIYEDYTHAAEILREKGTCDVSVEILVNELSFDANTKIMNIGSFNFQGVTILGVTTDESHQKIMPGMEGSNITISDFSAENNSFVFNMKDFKEEIISEVLSRIDYIKAAFSAEAKTTGKEEDIPMDFEENIKEVTEEVEVTDVMEKETTEEETPEVVEEFDGESGDDSGDDPGDDPGENDETEPEPPTDEEIAGEVSDAIEAIPETVALVDEAAINAARDAYDNLTEEQKALVSSSDVEKLEQAEADVAVIRGRETSRIEDEDAPEWMNNSLNYSVTIGGTTKEFAVSLADKINAITVLVNDTYSEADNTFYYCDVYEDDGKYCVMHDVWNDKHFRQEYSVKKDVYSLKGDRVQVFAQYLTSDEINKLDQMKSNYSAIESELNSYKEKELHSQREAILASEDYSVMADFEEFNNLKSNMDNYSVDDLTKEADLIYAKYMKSNYSSFAAASKDQQQKKHSVVFMTSGENKEEERLPYGGLFKNFKGKK